MKKDEIEYNIASIKLDVFQNNTIPSLSILGANNVIFAFSRRVMMNKITKNTNNMIIIMMIIMMT